MRDIHTTIVSQHLAARDNNKILRTHPPQVSSTEENLPRHTRRTLAQLRTNKFPFLLSYLHKIDASTHPSPLCPLCRTHEHTTQHLLSCPQIPTTLSALDLWRDPSGIAALLDDWREKLAANPHKTTAILVISIIDSFCAQLNYFVKLSSRQNIFKLFERTQIST